MGLRRQQQVVPRGHVVKFCLKYQRTTSFQEVTLMMKGTKHIQVFLTLVLSAGYHVCVSAMEPLPDDVLAMIEDWAPLIWLHPEEQYFPSSVEFFFDNSQVRSKDQVVRQEDPTRFTVLTGPETSDMHLNTITDLEHPDSRLDWFGGQNISEFIVPTYVFVKDYNDNCGTYDVAYRALYPYNYGKDVCIGIMKNGTCEGIFQSFGNHVGDWEHFTIRIRYGKVEACY